MKYALVEFKEGGRVLKRLVETVTIKGFNPCSGKDIHDATYQVKWQDSFHDDGRGIHDDGCFPGKILVLGDSPTEIKLKAKDQKIRLPSSFPKDDVRAETPPLKKPLRKRRSTKMMQSEKPENISKRKRMEKTLALVSKEKEVHDSEQTSVSKTSLNNNPNSESPSSSLSLVSPKSVPSSPGCSSSNSCTTLKAKTTPTKSVKPNLKPSSTSSPKKTISSPHGKWEKKEMASKLSNTVKDLDLMKKSPSKEGTSEKVSDTETEDSEKDLEESHDEEDEDDATVQLDALRKEHKQCEEKIRAANLVIRKFRIKVQEYRDESKKNQKELEDLKVRNSNLQEELNDCKVINFKLQRELHAHHQATEDKSKKKFVPNPDDSMEREFVSSSRHLKESTPKDDIMDIITDSEDNEFRPSAVRNLSFEDHNASKISKEADVNLKINPQESSFETSKSPKGETKAVKKSLETSSAKNADESDEESIINRIKLDLTGKKRLPVEGDRVYIGSGHYFNQRHWSDKVRKQPSDSRFYKECAQALYGIDGLSTRTVEKPTGTKTAATPYKLKLLNAVLKGRLRARNLSQEEETITMAKTKKWLGDKMYDCTRPRKPKPE